MNILNKWTLFFLRICILQPRSVVLGKHQPNNTVMLSWTEGYNKISFICTVMNLNFEVEFLHNSMPIDAYCTAPYPKPYCHSYNHNIIAQDLETNSTILVLTRKQKTSYSGVWSCKHGSNRDKSVDIIIPIKKEEEIVQEKSQTFLVVLSVIMNIIVVVVCLVIGCVRLNS